MTRTVITRALILLLAPLVLIGGLYLWVVLRSPRADSGKLVRTADRKIVWSGDKVQVQLHLNADRELPVRTDNVARKPHVIALVIDHSGSMGQGPESPLEAVKSAAAIFAHATASSEQPVGVVAFDGGTSEVMPLSPDGNACAGAIQQIPPGGGTDIAAGLLAGRSMVMSGLQSGKYPTASGLIVLLSDGQSSRDEAIKAAEQAKADRIRIISIGLGSQIDEALLKQMASSEADFHFTLDPAGLGDIYSTIAADFGTVIGYNAQLTEQFNYGGFKLEKGPVGLPVQGDPARGELNFRFPVLFQQRQEITYTLRAQKIGLFGLALKSADLTYVPDSNAPDQKRQIVSSLAPPLLVISPLLLLLLYLPLLGYIIWRLLHRPPEIMVAPEVTQVARIPEPPPLPLSGPGLQLERKPQPTLFLGLGETGSVLLAQVARLLSNDRYLDASADLPFHLLYADTREAVPSSADARLPIHKVQLPNSLTAAVRRLQSSSELPPHLDWVPRGDLTQIAGGQLDLSQGAHGRRWLTRLALFEACQSSDSPFLQAWQRAVEWLEQHPRARIIVMGSLQGTGSALASDLAYLLRQALPTNSRVEWPIYALGLADIPSDHAYTGSNQRAFLAELDRLTIATEELTQPAVFNPEPPPGFEYLDGSIREPVYDHFFLLQAPSRTNSDNIDREFFSEVAAICHTFTEQKSALSVEAYLGSRSTDEEKYRNKYSEGTISSAWQYLLRFPVPEIARRLACRFVCEVLGTNRLVGVKLAADEMNLEQPPLPKNPLEEAVNQWPRLSGAERGAGQIYQAFCQAAVSDEPRTVVPALQQAAQGTTPSLDDFREELRSFATSWFYLYLNGSPSDSADERANSCAHKILLLHAVLAQLVRVGQSALTLQQERGAGSSATVLVPLLEEIQRFHETWLTQVRSWLETLIDPDFVSPPPTTAFKGTFRSASDEYRQIEQTLRDEDLSAWQTIFDGDNLQDSRLREDVLYQGYIGAFLEKEHGFLLRWFWEFTAESADRVPDLRLRVVTDESRVYGPGADTAQALRQNLFQLADSLTRDLDRLTILDALRSETGELRLKPLATRLGDLDRGDYGLRIDRLQGGEEIPRKIFVMIPALQDQELQKFQEELRRNLAFELTLVPHGDPHAIRVLIVDSVVPIKSAQLQPFQGDVLPFICEPEQEGERLRSEITKRLGVEPCPQFHPLTRLLAAAPRPRAEWAGILAEDCIKPSTIDGIKPTLDIVDGSTQQHILHEHQEKSWMWAILNLAYREMGFGPAETARLNWQTRDRRTRVEMLDKAVQRLEGQAESLRDPSAERQILSQMILLLKLEHELEQRRYEEENS